MYGRNPVDDAKRVVRAVLSNQLARFSPRLYIRLTGQTGRGGGEESAQEIAAYFQKCFDEYFQVLQVAPDMIDAYLAGKHVVEYGPGDVPGVALLMAAHGAERVTCVDRFPLVSQSEKNIQVLRLLMDSLHGEAKVRAEACFRKHADPASGFRREYIRYLVRPGGLSGLSDSADLIVSRAVLEHVEHLSSTFADMRRTLRPGAVAVHQVDLKSHGLHRHNPLDFLTWPADLWSRMYRHKGVPNRWRVDRYRRYVEENELNTRLLQPTEVVDVKHIEEVRPYLAPQFQAISDEDLSWLGFWLVCAKE
jgi:SAM-dependent methyltransferase